MKDIKFEKKIACVELVGKDFIKFNYIMLKRAR